MLSNAFSKHILQLTAAELYFFSCLILCTMKHLMLELNLTGDKAYIYIFSLFFFLNHLLWSDLVLCFVYRLLHLCKSPLFSPSDLSVSSTVLLFVISLIHFSYSAFLHVSLTVLLCILETTFLYTFITLYFIIVYETMLLLIFVIPIL